MKHSHNNSKSGGPKPPPSGANVQHYPTGIVRMYNSDIFALFVLTETSTLLAAKFIGYLKEFDLSDSGKIKVQDFGARYGGRQKYTLPVIYLLFLRHYDRAGKDTAAFDLMNQNAVVELLATAAFDVYAPYFLFLCCLFQFLTIDEDDFVEYLFWLLTKGERTLDRGDIAMLLQVILGDKKDAFVTQHKDTIEKIFVDQGSEAIVLNRLQVINASLSGIFTRILKELQANLLQNLFGPPKVYKDILNHISRALYTHQNEAYDRIRFHKHVAANHTIIRKKKEIRKEIRTILRMMKSYWHLKENTTLMFKYNGMSFAKMIQVFFASSGPRAAKLVNPSSSQSNTLGESTSSLQGLQQAAELAQKKKRKKFNNPVLAWIDETIMHPSKQTEEDVLLKEMAELPDEALDPFKFEEEFAYTLEATEEALFRECRHTRKSVHRSIEDTELMLAEVVEEMNMTFESLGLSTRNGAPIGRMGSFFSGRSDLSSADEEGVQRHRGGHGSFHLPQELLERKAKLQMIQETLHEGIEHNGQREEDEDAIMRAVQDLGRRYEQAQHRTGRRSMDASSMASSKKRQKSSFFGSFSLLGSSNRSMRGGSNADGDIDSSDDEESNGTSSKKPAKSALATADPTGKKKHRRVSIAPEEVIHEQEESDSYDGEEEATGRSSRKKNSLLSDIEQAKSMEKLSSLLTSSAKGGGASQKRPSSSSGKQQLPVPSESPEQDEANNAPMQSRPTSSQGSTAMSRLNQWKARKQQKAEAAVEAESVQVDELRGMLMVEKPDDEDIDMTANLELNEQFKSAEGLDPLLASAALSDLANGANTIAKHGNTSTILVSKDENGRVNLTKDQHFALDSYNYEKEVERKFDQEAFKTLYKKNKT